MIIDIMSTKNLDSMYFTCVKADEKAIIYYKREENGALYNAFGYRDFSFLDHITILSIGIVMPLSFQLWPYDTLPEILFKSNHNEGSVEIERFFIPFENYELPIGKFQEFNSQVITGQYFLSANMLGIEEQNFQVSMINLPDQLDEHEFPIHIFAKIQHTLPLE